MIEQLTESIKKHEGCKLKSYKDTKGIWTIGYGRNLSLMGFTMAVEENLEISQELADLWLEVDINTAHVAAEKFPQYPALDTEARQAAFIEMVFNIGAKKLQEFHHMLKAIEETNWPEAEAQAIDSDWADQVGQRAHTLAAMLGSGEFPA